MKHKPRTTKTVLEAGRDRKTPRPVPARDDASRFRREESIPGWGSLPPAGPRRKKRCRHLFDQLSKLAFGLLLAAGLAAPARAAFTGDSPAIYQRPATMFSVESEMHLARQRWEMASRSLERALHDQPDNVRIAQKLADLYLRMEQYGKAILLLEDFLPHASPRNNIYYMVGFAHDRLNHFQEALGYYGKAIRLDPGRLSIYVRAAQVRLRQGLVYDAAKILRKALSIDRDYAPAIEELAVVNELIKKNQHNVYRRGNMVILFRDFRQFPQVERLYPLIERYRQTLEANLKYHIPLVWVKILPKIDHHENPPALFNWSEDTLMISEETLEKSDHRVIGHELTYLYVAKMTDNNAPRWLTEGIALWQSRPAFLSATPLRSTSNLWPENARFLSAEKRYLAFETLDDDTRRTLVRAFVATRFLLDNYGWEGMRKVLLRYAEGIRRFETISAETLHIPMRQLIARWNIYCITNFFFRPTTRIRTLNTDKGPGKT